MEVQRAHGPPTVGTWSAKSATTATAASDETTAAARLWSVQMVADDAANTTATLGTAGGANAVRRLWRFIGPYCNATLEMTQALAQSLTQRSDVSVMRGSSQTAR